MTESGGGKAGTEHVRGPFKKDGCTRRVTRQSCTGPRELLGSLGAGKDSRILRARTANHNCEGHASATKAPSSKSKSEFSRMAKDTALREHLISLLTAGKPTQRLTMR